MVLDASAAVELLLGTEAGLVVARRLRGALHAPHLLDVEVAAALRRLERAREIPAPVAEEALADLLRLPLERHRHSILVARAWELRGSVTPYDAMYLALAEALDAPLLTRDARLGRAHGHRARVEVV